MNPFKLFPWFTIFFAVILTAELIGLSGYPQVRLASKGMIMASLLGIYILRAKRQEPIVLSGMIFALLGDSFLLFNGDTFFLIGLVCFLVMQICYSIAFWKKRRIPKARHKLVAASFLVLPIGVLSFGWSQFGNMLGPVVVYALAITVMLITAYLRHPKLNGYKNVLLGSILFVLSDLALAIGKFITDFPLQSYTVMITYIFAQYLIITGLLIDEQPQQTEGTKPDKTFGRHKAVK